MKVLADTSVWVAHFKQSNPHLVSLLHQGCLVCHPHVVLEIACGTPPQRRYLIDLLSKLESSPLASLTELHQLIESRSLFGRGCGLVDISLLGSVLLDRQCWLWTFDKRLHQLAVEHQKAYVPLILQ